MKLRRSASASSHSNISYLGGPCLPLFYLHFIQSSYVSFCLPPFCFSHKGGRGSVSLPPACTFFDSTKLIQRLKAERHPESAPLLFSKKFENRPLVDRLFLLDKHLFTVYTRSTQGLSCRQRKRETGERNEAWALVTSGSVQQALGHLQTRLKIDIRRRRKF